MQTASLPPDAFQDLLDRLPPDFYLGALAVSTKAIERCRKVGDGTPCAASPCTRPRRHVPESDRRLGSHDRAGAIERSRGKYRLDEAVPFLKALIEQQLAERAGSANIRWAGSANVRWAGRTLCVVDGTHIKPRASKGTDWLVRAGFDLGTGGFFHLELTDQHGAESVERGAPKPGKVRIGDRNYANAAARHRFREQSGGPADFIVRVRWKAFVLSRPGSAPFDLIEHLGTLPSDMTPHKVRLESLRRRLDWFPNKRRGVNATHPAVVIGMAAFSVFFNTKPVPSSLTNANSAIGRSLLSPHADLIGLLVENLLRDVALAPHPVDHDNRPFDRQHLPAWGSR
nr:hypothetical protein [uncultured Rhodopila sp.]